MNYKVTKIGLLNFWYFDEEEFYFSDGKILLRGENGSGKSVTMQSFIPLILDGNKAPSRLDPFGSKEKRIEDYLLGPADGIQKEDVTGYLYMEVYHEEKSKYITVGMGLRARKGQSTDFWGFALKDGRRIGEDFHLYKDYAQKVLLNKKELRARLGEDNEYTESTKDYKSMVNQLLFGFKELDAYDEFINVLLQLRSSKLSKEYTPTKLMSILSSVLQPLTEEDVRPLSEAIEDTNKTREKVETLQKQVKSLTNLLKTYQNYNEIILYHKALSVDVKSDEIKTTKSTIQKTEKEIGEMNKRLEEIKIKFERLEKEYIENKARLDTIDNKDLQKYTSDLVTIEDNINKVNTSVDMITEKIENILMKEKNIEQELQGYQDKIDRNEKDLSSICSDVSSLSEEVKLADIHAAVMKIAKREEANFEYLKERVNKYKVRLNQVKLKLEEKEKLENALSRLEEEHLIKNKQYDEKEKERKKEESNLKEQKDAFKDQINLLNQHNQMIKIEQEIKNKIFTWINEYNHENYVSAKEEYQRLCFSYENTVLTEKNNVASKKNTIEEELEVLKEELDVLKNSKELEIEEEQEVLESLNAKNIPYIPFYKAIEFKENIKETDRNKIEELLITMNILNAKIISHKDLKLVSNINTVFLKAGKKKQHNLLEYFTVLGNDKISKEEITSVLESISINPEEENYISTNSYQLDFIIGYPGKEYESKYIGIMKRIENQQRMIHQKEEEIENKVAMITNYQNILNGIQKKLEIIHLEMNGFPSNRELEEKKQSLDKIEVSLEILSKQDQELTNKIMETTKVIEEKLVEINSLKENISVPLNLASYKETIELVEELKNSIHDLQITYQSLEMNLEQKLSYENRLSDLKLDFDYQNEELTDKNRELNSLLSKKKTIEEILENPDYQELMQELQKLTRRQSEIPDEKGDLKEEKGKIENELLNLEDSLGENQKKLNKDLLELELRNLILEKEYQLNYVYRDGETMNVTKILSDLKERKNNDMNRALVNYLDSYNEYRLDLLEYRLNTKEISNISDEICEKLIGRGMDERLIESLKNESVRQDMSSIYQGKVINIYQLEECLRQAIIESESYINTQESHLFQDILLKTVGNKIRDRIESSKIWVSKMNEIMQNTQIDSNLSFQLEWKSKVAYTEEELDTKELVRLFKIDAGQLNDEDGIKLRTHFQSQIKKELEYSEKTHESYANIISRVLDYRNWFEFKLYYRRKQGEKKELTNKVFFVLSGGERAKSMYVPLFASVYAKLLTARKDSLRLIALDEAFAGVDHSNIREMFAILSQLDLDYILTSQSLWGDYDSISSISIAELIKDEVNKAVAVRRYRWNGHSMEMLERMGDSNIYE